MKNLNLKKLKIVVILALVFAMALPIAVYADNFVPSVEAKMAPELVTQKGSNGQDVAAVIIDKDGNIVYDVGSLELIITPLADADEAPLVEIRDSLKEAYIEMQSANNLGELSVDMWTALERYQEKTDSVYYKETTMDDLVVSDLFDATLVGNGVEILHIEGYSVRICLRTNITPDEMFFVLHMREPEKWEVVENATVDEDGILTFVLDSLPPIAIIRENHEKGSAVVTEPVNNCNCSGWFCLCSCWWKGFITGAVVTVAIGYIVQYAIHEKKKKSKHHHISDENK